MPRNASSSSRLLYALLVSVLTGVLLAAAAFPLVGSLGLTAKAGAEEFLVLPAQLEAADLNQRSRILAADGSTIAVLYKENRVEAALADIPELTRKAVLAIEDSRFYAHKGVDYKGTLRAAIENLQAGGVSQGGSTLTQQYVKNALLLSADEDKEAQQAATEQSLDRKLKEARYALAIERRMTKDQILEGYLNIAYYGNGVYGIGTAASFYFSTPVKELTLAQSALLAGIVQTPGRFDPVKAQKDPAVMDALLARRDLVLSRMRDLGYITEAERAAAAAEVAAPGKPLFRIKPVASGCEAPGVKAPYFCDFIRRTLEEDTPLGRVLGKTREERQARLLGGGLTIKTTLSPGIQAIAQRSVEEAVPPADPEQIGAVADVVEPGTGNVKAMAVNRRYTERDVPGHTKVNLAMGGSSGFQGGSTFKAFVLADALRQGIPLGFTLNAPSPYVSKVFDLAPGEGPYMPKNSGDSYSGTFDLRTATHASVNTYFVQLEERLAVDGKVEGAASLAEQMGIRKFDGTPLNRNGSFVLGGDEVSPLDMAAAYATFAARGLYCPPRGVDQILDAEGEQLTLPAPACKQVLEQPIADTVNQVMTGVIDGDTRGRTGRSASIGRPAAGKTGTTNGSKAAWFVGYTPQLSTAVWVGDPGKPPAPVKEMRRIRINGQYYPQVYGGTIPAPIWRRTMREALANMPEVAFERPDRDLEDGEEVAIPDVAGFPLDVAEQTLIEAGFSVRDGRRVATTEGIREGLAAYTFPRAGREVPFGSTVILYEATGRVRTAVAPAPTPDPGVVTVAEPAPAAPREPPGQTKRPRR